jgi:membrane-bound inhibitor of C-type lysozyme
MRYILACFVLVWPVSSASAAEAAYRCADGTALRAAFSAPGRAGSVRLTFGGQGRPVMLAQAPSADGGRYVSDGMEFWIKGKTARLTRAGVATECQTQ